MSENMVLELIGLARDAARARNLYRLAEHLDDAILVAASDFHAAPHEAEAERSGGHGDCTAGGDGTARLVN